MSKQNYLPYTHANGTMPDAVQAATGGRSASFLGVCMEAFEHQLVAFLENLFQTIGWAGVVIIMALESANIPIPSEVTMPLAGWFLAEAKGESALYAFLVGGFFGALGCTIGSIIAIA